MIETLFVFSTDDGQYHSFVMPNSGPLFVGMRIFYKTERNETGLFDLAAQLKVETIDLVFNEPTNPLHKPVIRYEVLCKLERIGKSRIGDG